MEIAKQVFDMLPEDGDKLSEKELKALTSLNLGQVKEAKKFLKENGLTKAYRGRGGYVSLVEGAEFPVEENTMTKGEKIAAAKEEKRIVNAETKRRNDMVEKVKTYVEKEFPDADEVQVDWGGYDLCYAFVWKSGYAKGYKVYADEI